MTTAIHDIQNGQVASDTRWSLRPTELSDGQEYFIYTDDSSFEKIFIKKGHAIIFAGNGLLISQFKQWWNQDNPDVEVMPATSLNDEPVALILIDIKQNLEMFNVGEQYILRHSNNNCSMMGTGSLFAMECWALENCSIKAIKHASKNDNATSEAVIYYNFATELGNIQNQCMDYSEIHASILKDGKMIAIELDTKQAANEPTLITDHPLGHEVISKIASGELTISAPVSITSRISWSDEDRQRLKMAFQVALDKGYQD